MIRGLRRFVLRAHLGARATALQHRAAPSSSLQIFLMSLDSLFARRCAVLVTLAAALSVQSCTSDSGAAGPTTAPGGFMASFGAGPLSVTQGASIRQPVRVTRSGGFAGAITFAISGAPAGLAANVETVTPDSASLVLSATDGLPAANYSIDVTARASGLPDQRSTLVVTVLAKPSTNVPGLASITVGNRTACALSMVGVAYCWGENSNGELGNGTTSNSSTPAAVAGGLTFADLYLGAASQSACGIVSGGAAYCWGNNAFGQLGDGTQTARLTPTRAAAGLNFVSLSVGSRHVCGVTHDFAAYCWGLNTDGDLGDGTKTLSAIPVRVSGLEFTSVSSGDDFTCGLTRDGAAYCWGLGNRGQLGNGKTESSSTPVPASGGLTFTALAAGTYDVCGLTADGSAYCWGYNYSGEVGDGTTTQRTVPVPVLTDHKFVQLSAGVEHFCGASGGGDVYCWGYNATGVLGDGTTDQRSIPTLVTGGRKFRLVAVGNTHACAVQLDAAPESNVAYCWGQAALGDGTTTSSSSPVRVRFP